MNQKAGGALRRQALGTRAEREVQKLLEAQGFAILGRNVRVGHLEVDLLVRRDDLVAVVEVRYRGPQAWQGPFESVGAVKRQRLRSAGRLLWYRRFASDPTVRRMRFDVAAVTVGPDGETRIEYAAAAF
jgi:putative endonuclease